MDRGRAFRLSVTHNAAKPRRRTPDGRSREQRRATFAPRLRVEAPTRSYPLGLALRRL
jgi:hypothetical protein